MTKLSGSDTKDSVGKVISKLPDRFESSKELFHLALLFRCWGCLIKKLLHTLKSILETTFAKCVELLANMVLVAEKPKCT